MLKDELYYFQQYYLLINTIKTINPFTVTLSDELYDIYKEIYHGLKTTPLEKFPNNLKKYISLLPVGLSTEIALFDLPEKITMLKELEEAIQLYSIESIESKPILNNVDLLKNKLIKSLEHPKLIKMIRGSLTDVELEEFLNTTQEFSDLQLKLISGLSASLKVERMGLFAIYMSSSLFENFIQRYIQDNHLPQDISIEDILKQDTFQSELIQDIQQQEKILSYTFDKDNINNIMVTSKVYDSYINSTKSKNKVDSCIIDDKNKIVFIAQCTASSNIEDQYDGFYKAREVGRHLVSDEIINGLHNPYYKYEAKVVLMPVGIISSTVNKKNKKTKSLTSIEQDVYSEDNVKFLASANLNKEERQLLSEVIYYSYYVNALSQQHQLELLQCLPIVLGVHMDNIHQKLSEINQLPKNERLRELSIHMAIYMNDTIDIINNKVIHHLKDTVENIAYFHNLNNVFNSLLESIKYKFTEEEYHQYLQPLYKKLEIFCKAPLQADRIKVERKNLRDRSTFIKNQERYQEKIEMDNWDGFVSHETHRKEKIKPIHLPTHFFDNIINSIKKHHLSLTEDEINMVKILELAKHTSLIRKAVYSNDNIFIEQLISQLDKKDQNYAKNKLNELNDNQLLKNKYSTLSLEKLNEQELIEYNSMINSENSIGRYFVKKISDQYKDYYKHLSQFSDNEEALIRQLFLGLSYSFGTDKYASIEEFNMEFLNKSSLNGTLRKSLVELGKTYCPDNPNLFFNHLISIRQYLVEELSLSKKVVNKILDLRTDLTASSNENKLI